MVLKKDTKGKGTPSFPIDDVAWDNLFPMTEQASNIFPGQRTKLTFTADENGAVVVTIYYAEGHIQFTGDGSRILEVSKKR